jgi:hypothetical protein
VILNGRYGANENPPIPVETIDILAKYVENGGSLFVNCEGTMVGSGGMLRFYNPLVSRFGLKYDADTDIGQNDRMGRVADHPAVAGLVGFDAEYGVPVKGSGEILAYCGQSPVVIARDYGRGRVIVSGCGLCFLGALLNPSANTDKTPEKNKAFLMKLVDYDLARQNAR